MRTRSGKKTETPDTDDEDVYDEVDRFHQADRDLGKDFGKKGKATPVEVLNVEGDYSDDEGERRDDGNVSSDWEGSENGTAEDAIEAQLPSREGWGKKRSAFYSTSYVDKDFGTVNDDEDAEAELELEDAKIRQKALDAAAADLDVFDDDEDATTAAVTEVIKDESQQWDPKTARKKNQEAVNILNDYKLKMEMFNVIVRPLSDVAKALPEDSPLRVKLILCANTYGCYRSTVEFWLAMKADSISTHKINDLKVDEHPCLAKIWRLKEMTDKVDEFVGRNSSLLSKLIGKAAEGADVDYEEHYPVISQKRAIRQKEKEELKRLEEDAEMDDAEEDDEANQFRAFLLFLGSPWATAKRKRPAFRRARSDSSIRKLSSGTMVNARRSNTEQAWAVCILDMNRALGEGRITKVVKKYAFLQDEKVGKVYVPLEAARIMAPDCCDLRDRFQENDVLIFTASKQPYPTNDCKYAASSVIKQSELIKAYGKITDVLDKHCIVEAKKYGRIFVPYSARTPTGKLWLGRNAEKGKTCAVRIFRQPDINTCKYVAFGCEITFDDGLTEDMKLKNTRAPDNALTQIGCIVRYSTGSDCHVYSTVTGLARLPAASVQDWMHMGGWLRYAVVRDPKTLSVSDNVNDQRAREPTWLVKDPVDLGMLFELEEDQMDSSRLQLNVTCVINRVNRELRQTWLWNDFIGRVYVPPANFCNDFQPMESVKVRVVYTAAFDDVPWTANQLEYLGNDEATRLANSSLLITDDDWKISHVQSGPGSFFGFMDNPKFGSAFIAWTDIADDDFALVKEQRCRATVFRQHREKKHNWRCVLVTPLENVDALYPVHKHSGQMRLPKPFRPPRAVPQPAPVAPPPPHIPLPMQAPIGTRVTQERTMASVLRASPPPGIPGLPMEFGPLIKTRNSDWPAPSQRLPSLQQICPNPKGANFNSLPPSGAPTPSMTSSSCPLSEDGSESPFESRNFLEAQMANDFRMDAFAPWMAPADTIIPSSVLPLSFSTGPMIYHPSVSTADASTQTEMICEQRVLKDILNHQDLFKKVFDAFPGHMETMLKMNW
ncbi:unnamed protein product, partial [Mesorhabditis spiculigera]